MSHKSAATVALTIGIDTGKNTLHLIGLDGDVHEVATLFCGRNPASGRRYCLHHLRIVRA